MQAPVSPRNSAPANTSGNGNADRPSSPAAPIPINSREKPTSPGEWTLERTLQKLNQPLPSSMLKIKTIQGNQIPYLPWHVVVTVLNRYCPGWSWSVTQIHTTSDRLFLVGRLTLATADGTVFQEATGTEDLGCNAFGDPSSNAEAMALRRAAAKFGLALDLYKR